MFVVWILVAAGLSVGTIMTAFMILGSAKRLLDAEKKGLIKLRPAIKGTCYFWVLVGYPADVVYDFIWGPPRFYEFHFGTYSDRIQQIVDRGSAKKNYDDALNDARMMNVVDENHIKDHFGRLG